MSGDFGNKSISVDRRPDNHASLELDGRRYRVVVARVGDTFLVAVDGQTYTLQKASPSSSSSGVDNLVSPEVTAPMPGKIVRVDVRVGDRVTGGDPVVILEAMKMENRLVADAPGIVEAVHVAAGDLVDGGQVLVVIRYDAS